MNRRPPFQIKICGITRPNDAVAAVQAGADAIGLNFYSGSPRFIELDRARNICEAVEQACSANRIAYPLVVGVFVNSSAAQIAEAISNCPLDAVQFHGDESIKILSQLSQELLSAKSNKQSEPPKGLITLRVVRFPVLANSDRSAIAKNLESNLAEIIDEASTWEEAGVDAILVDAAAPGEFGGSGKKFDWSLVRRLNVGLPLILAGGLNPQNIAQAIDAAGVEAVDVASGVESAPGVKDELLMRQFVQRSGMRF